jgi:hypothetical protein
MSNQDSKIINFQLPFIGIFWYYSGKILSFKIPINSTEIVKNETVIDSNFLHSILWNEITKRYKNLKSKEFFDLPYGRVLRKEEKYVCYVTENIYNNSFVRDLILHEFKLRPTFSEFRIYGGDD